MDPVLQKAYEAYVKGQCFVFATIVENTLQGTARKSGSKMVVLSDGATLGTVGGGMYEKTVIQECRKALKTHKPKLLTFESFGKKGQGICGGTFSVFIEPFSETQELIICGAGHIALALSLLAKMLGYKVTVIDSRKEFANKRRFSHIDRIICQDPGPHLRRMNFSKRSHIMIVTHDHRIDLTCLKSALQTNAGYIGVIGSKIKREKFLKAISLALRRKPLIKKRIRMPAGIDIGAQTPEEIAVSIMAEIISHDNKDWVHSRKFIEKS